VLHREQRRGGAGRDTDLAVSGSRRSVRGLAPGPDRRPHKPDRGARVRLSPRSGLAFGFRRRSRVQADELLALAMPTLSWHL